MLLLRIKNIFLFGLVLLLFDVSGFSQVDSTSFELQIYYGSSDTIRFCSDSIVAAPDIKIEGDGFNEANEGVKVSIANYRRDEDTLVYYGSDKLSANWINNNGYLEITGIGTSKEYEDAIKQVYYKNLKEVPTLGVRNLSITLKDADFLPATQHFYKFIKKTDITWTEARDSASRLTYNKLQGYLTTITSYAENSFIWGKIDGVGWIGATDEEVEGDWKWAAGPENGTLFWRGLSNGVRINNEYSDWSSGEPNNQGDEDYAHINQHPSKRDKSWNDLPNVGGGPNSDYYRAQGFIVEFGGMSDDPEIRLSASVNIEISKIAFSDEREFTICSGDNQELNLEAPNEYSYEWIPAKNISDNFSSNPVVFPDESTVYQAIGQLGSCIDTAAFLINVNDLPKHSWDTLNTICVGNSIGLDPGEHASYLWGTLETNRIYSTSEEGWYSVTLTNEFGCSKLDSAEVKYSVSPKINYNDLDTLVCGSFQQKLNLTFDKNNVQSILNSLQGGVVINNKNTLNPDVEVNKYGAYNFELLLKDEFNCDFSDTIKIEFHNQPTAGFQIDSANCKGYNLELVYEGITVEPAEFSWFSNDTLYKSGIDLDNLVIPLGYGVSNRSVGLIINEQGCIDSLKLPVTVKPILDFWPVDGEGCTPLNVEFDFDSPEPVDSFYWDFGNGTISNLPKPESVYLNTGVEDQLFDVWLTIVSDEGCKNTGLLADTIKVHPIPTLDFDFNEGQCYPDTFSVNYIGSGNDNDFYSWGLTGFEEDEILVDPLNGSGPFQFTRQSAPTVAIGLRVISEFSCKSDSIVKIFKRKPVFKIDLDTTTGCPPVFVNMNVIPIDSIDQVFYSWTISDGFSGSGKNIGHEFNGNNNIFDIAVVSNSSITGCSDSVKLSEAVFVYPVPEAQFSPKPAVVIISNPIINFENQSSGAEFFQWDFNDLSALSEEENPQHRFPDMGWYDVLLKSINDFGCFDTTMHQVIVAFDRLFPPNAFSPNALNEEDREFRIHSEGISEGGYLLRVYNRWGEVVFESESKQNGWDGKMKNGTNAPAGVYNWIIQYNDFRDEKHKQQGTVTLLY